MIEVGREEGHEYLDLSRSTFDSTRLDSKAESKSQRGEKWVTDRDPRSSRRTRTDVSPILRHACTLFHRLVVSYRLYRTHAIRSAAQKKNPPPPPSFPSLPPQGPDHAVQWIRIITHNRGIGCQSTIKREKRRKNQERFSLARILKWSTISPRETGC